MTRHKNAPAGGQPAQGELIKPCTTDISTHPDPLAVAKHGFVQQGQLYSELKRAVMITVDDPAVEKAIGRFMREYDRAAQALHDERTRAAVRHMARAADLGEYLTEQRHEFRLLQVVPNE